MAEILRTRIKKDIVSEFVKPARPSNKVAVILGGAPSVPSKKHLLEFLAKKGYWAFFPRYRGTWESGGLLFKKSPVVDVLDLLDQLPKGFKDLRNNKTYKLNPSQVVLFSCSFGGAIGLLAAKDKRVSKVIALSPLVDWRAKRPAEPNALFYFELRVLFFMGYRFKDSDWRKVAAGKLFNPIDEAGKIDGKKIFIIHAKDDKVVTLPSVLKFAKMSGSQIKVLKKWGHFSVSDVASPAIWKRVSKFIKSK